MTGAETSRSEICGSGPKCLSQKRPDVKCLDAKCPGPIMSGFETTDPTCSGPKRADSSKAHMSLWRFCCALAIEYKCKTSNTKTNAYRIVMNKLKTNKNIIECK